MKLTKSQEHYLKAAYVLSCGHAGARVCDIAAHLSVSKASASRAITKLEKQGYLYKDDKRLVCLTQKGKKKSLFLMNSYDVVKELLTSVLGIEDERAKCDACEIEHALSPQSVEMLEAYLNTWCTTERLPNQGKK